MKILLALSLFAVLFIGFYFILLSGNNNLLCAIFNWEERRLWRKFIKNYDNFKLLSSNNFEKEFISNCGNYRVIVWGNNSFIEEGLCSIYDAKTDKCILSRFDERMSKIMANKLLSKLGSNEGA